MSGARLHQPGACDLVYPLSATSSLSLVCMTVRSTKHTGRPMHSGPGNVVMGTIDQSASRLNFLVVARCRGRSAAGPTWIIIEHRCVARRFFVRWRRTHRPPTSRSFATLARPEHGTALFKGRRVFVSRGSTLQATVPTRTRRSSKRLAARESFAFVGWTPGLVDVVWRHVVPRRVWARTATCVRTVGAVGLLGRPALSQLSCSDQQCLNVRRCGFVLR
jgi:hypothetical protein